MRDRFVLPARLGGGGFRPALGRAQFLSTPNNVAPQFLAIEHSRGLSPSLDSVFGAGSFNAESAATRWGALYASGSRYALELHSELVKLQRARNGAVTDAHQNRIRRQRENLRTKGREAPQDYLN